MTDIVNMKEDQLLEIFYKHLKKNEHKDNIEEFTHNVVADYLFYLMNVGHIPSKALDSLEVDLKEEVIELYHKVQSSPIKNVLLKKKASPQPQRTRRIN
jgi:hypothetical protein